MTEPAPRSALYRGRIVHQRLQPVRHRFSYRVFSLYVDLDELDHLGRGLRLLSVDQPNLISFRVADHGPRDGRPLKPWALRQLAAAGVELGRPRIMLLCFPRVLGCAFNPLSVYYAFDGPRLAGLLYEVKNTFGEQHVYAFAVRGASRRGRLVAHGCAKGFFVSPFIDMAARYRFHLTQPGPRLNLVIEETEHDRRVLVASHAARRLPLSDRSILQCLVGNLFMGLKVIGGIHLEASRLWLKGVPCHPRPHREASPGLRQEH